MKNKIYTLYGWLEFMIFLFMDQFTKYMAVKKLKSQPSFKIWDHVLEFYYLENKGAAWGMLENARIFFIAMTVILLIVMFYYYKRLPEHKKWNVCRFLIIMLAAGAVGNLIDRLIRGYVIDFIYFKLINFPIFNIADCYVTISIALFMIIYRKEILKWIQSEPK